MWSFSRYQLLGCGAAQVIKHATKAVWDPVPAFQAKETVTQYSIVQFGAQIDPMLVAQCADLGQGREQSSPRASVGVWKVSAPMRSANPTEGAHA